MSPPPYSVFIIYAREDASYLDELLGHLRPLENAGRIRVWSDRAINPGEAWEDKRGVICRHSACCLAAPVLRS